MTVCWCKRETTAPAQFAECGRESHPSTGVKEAAVGQSLSSGCFVKYLLKEVVPKSSYPYLAAPRGRPWHTKAFPVAGEGGSRGGLA